MSNMINSKVKMLLGTVIGGLLGYAYYYFIGCNSGTCPLTSTCYITTIYGAIMGLILFIPTKKKNHS